MKEQSAPTPNGSQPIADLVIQDMHNRKALGVERYGAALQAHNGRDALLDAYEQALDLAVYLKQAIVERNDHLALLARMESAFPASTEHEKGM